MAVGTNYAQERHVCGTSVEALQLIQDRLIENKKNWAIQRNNSTQRNQMEVFIPLKFHLIARDNGSGRITTDDVFDQVCTINETFKDLNIQFYIKDGFNIVNSSRIYDSPTILTIQSEMNAIRDAGAVNIFVVREAQNPMSNRPGNTLGFYDSQRDWIVVERGEIEMGGMTLPHELGHFFSLPHPFNGWDAEPYDAAKHGSPAKEVSTGGVPTEYVDGSNCETAGDMICDTPADYLYFSEIDNINCRYKVPMIDPKGDTLQADPTLIMSYFLDRCMNRFSPMQAALMTVDYNGGSRAYLRDANFVAVTDALPEDPLQLLFPADDTPAPSTGDLRLDWEDMAGAKYYQVEIFPDNDDAYFLTATESAATIQVEIGERYRWRVKPYNDTQYCAPYSELRRFTADMASSVAGVTSLTSWSVEPNPVAQTATVRATIIAKEPFNAILSILNVAGQAIQTLPSQTFQAGMNHQLISTTALTPGLYLLAIDNGVGVLHQKLVIH